MSQPLRDADVDSAGVRLMAGAAIALEEIPERSGQPWRVVLSDKHSVGPALEAGPSRLWREADFLAVETRLDLGGSWFNLYVTAGATGQSLAVVSLGAALTPAYRLLLSKRPEAQLLLGQVAPLVSALARTGTVYIDGREITSVNWGPDSGAVTSVLVFVAPAGARWSIDLDYLNSVYYAVPQVMHLVAEAGNLDSAIEKLSADERKALLSVRPSWQNMRTFGPQLLNGAADIAEFLATVTSGVPR